MIYDYMCTRCDETHEESHGMLENPIIICECGYKCVKLISTGTRFCGVNGRADMYNFVDYNTTGKPVVINSKTQWRNHLKSQGLHDDIKNDPYTKSELESKIQQKNSDKQRSKKEIRKAVIDAYKNRKSPQSKQRVKEALKKV